MTTAPAPTVATCEIDADTMHTLHIRKEIEIAAPVEATFQAVLEEIGPGSRLPDGTAFPMKIEPWPGGRWFRDLGETGGHAYGHLWGHVQVIKAPTLLELVGPMPMSFPAMNHVQYRLKAQGAGTLLTLVHRAVGLLVRDHMDGMPDGWEHGIRRIKALAEQRGGR